MASKQFAIYQETQIQSAAPDILVLLVYDGAIRFMKQARVYIEEKNYEKANDCLLRAQGLVMELSKALNLEVWEGAANLKALYEYINHQLLEANIKKETSYLEEALKIITELRAAWAQAAKIYRQAHGRKLARREDLKGRV